MRCCLFYKIVDRQDKSDQVVRRGAEKLPARFAFFEFCSPSWNRILSVICPPERRGQFAALLRQVLTIVQNRDDRLANSG